MDVLSIDRLSVEYRSGSGCHTAVDSVSLSVPKGKSFGLVGESGSGKSTLGTAVMRLLPDHARMTSGRIVIEGEDVTHLPEARMRNLRWRKISMIFQAAMNALNPIRRVEDQVMEAIRTHEPEQTPPQVRQRVAELFTQVGIADNRRRDYPHQYSGGMRQRAVIAMALACRPSLVIADEPTTALDVIVQDQILTLLRGLQQTYHMSIMLISHDISVVADVCDLIGVLYAGQLVELGTRNDVFETPTHPYTRAVLDAHITLAHHRGEPKALGGEGTLPGQFTSACRFCDRCPTSEPACEQKASMLRRLSDSHFVRCCKDF